jgi:hypothetical protein
MTNRVLLFLASALFVLSSASAQQKTRSAATAKVKETPLYQFDAARAITHFDATSDGSMWFAVDKFGLLQNMITNGNRIQFDFNEVPVATAQLSPDGSFIIWMGLERGYDAEGFNTTTTHLYKNWRGKDGEESQLIGTFTSDYNSLQFFPKFGKWIAILPAANNVNQKGDRNLVLENGKIMSKNEPNPKMFSFDSLGTKWAYRSTDGAKENLITSEGNVFLYQRKSANPNIFSDDPIVMNFTPDIKVFGSIVDGRDYDIGFRASARLYKTSYEAKKLDTARSYIVFQDKKHPLFHWINSIQIDSAGKTIVYFASDPSQFAIPKGNDRSAIVVQDGKTIAGPFARAGKLFLSPSGKHIAYSAIKNNSKMYELFFDGKSLGTVGDYCEVYWSPDEKQIAFVTTDEKIKMYVNAGGKRSPSFERVGRIGWSKDKKSVEYVAIKTSTLVKVKQAL